MIRYDRTRISIVIVCDCGWTELGITKEAAWRLAADHEARVHPDVRQVRGAALKRLERAANGTHDEMSTSDGIL